MLNITTNTFSIMFLIVLMLIFFISFIILVNNNFNNFVDIQFKALIPRQGNLLIRDFMQIHDSTAKEFQPYFPNKFHSLAINNILVQSDQVYT